MSAVTRLEDVRCVYCGKLLCRMTTDALAPGGRVQHKCDRCNRFSERVGDVAGTDAKAVEPQSHPTPDCRGVVE